MTNLAHLALLAGPLVPSHYISDVTKIHAAGMTFGQWSSTQNGTASMGELQLTAAPTLKASDHYFRLAFPITIVRPLTKPTLLFLPPLPLPLSWLWSLFLDFWRRFPDVWNWWR